MFYVERKMLKCHPALMYLLFKKMTIKKINEFQKVSDKMK